jgi:hypothetical protein
MSIGDEAANGQQYDHVRGLKRCEKFLALDRNWPYSRNPTLWLPGWNEVTRAPLTEMLFLRSVKGPRF